MCNIDRVHDQCDVDNLEQLIIGMKEGLERKIKVLERKMDQGFAQINSRVDFPAALRPARHARADGPPLELRDGSLGRRRRHCLGDQGSRDRLRDRNNALDRMNDGLRRLYLGIA